MTSGGNKEGAGQWQISAAATGVEVRVSRHYETEKKKTTITRIHLPVAELGNAALNSRWSSLRWANQCGNIGCLTGDVVNLGSSYGFTDLDLSGLIIGVGQVTIRGQTYSLWVPGGGGARAQLQFDGVLVMPEVTSDTAYASAPFAFSGSLQIPNQKEPSTYDVFELRGSGVATALLSRDRFNAGRWHVSAVTYEFAPQGAVIPH